MKLGTQDKREYVVTRPRLMESLERQGFKGTPIKHPYSEHLRAWAFPLSRELAVFVANYYRDVIGRETPIPIQEYMRELGGNVWRLN